MTQPIHNTKAPIGLIKFIPMLRDAWNSPVFQRHLPGHKLRHWIHPVFALLFGVSTSIVIGLLISNIFKGTSIINLLKLLDWNVHPPIIVAMVICYARLVAPIFVQAPERLRQMSTAREIDPLASTPLEEHEIFPAEALSPILLGYKGIEEAVLFSAGIHIGFIFIYFYKVKTWNLETYVGMEVYFPATLLSIYTISTFVVILVLLSITSAKYCLKYPNALAIPMAVLEVSFIFLVCICLTSIVAVAIMSLSYIISEILVYLIIYAVPIVLLVLQCPRSLRSGISQFGRFRRSKAD